MYDVLSVDNLRPRLHQSLSVKICHLGLWICIAIQTSISIPICFNHLKFELRIPTIAWWLLYFNRILCPLPVLSCTMISRLTTQQLLWVVTGLREGSPSCPPSPSLFTLPGSDAQIHHIPSALWAVSRSTSPDNPASRLGLFPASVPFWYPGQRVVIVDVKQASSARHAGP